jgi:hypothetical protein
MHCLGCWKAIPRGAGASRPRDPGENRSHPESSLKKITARQRGITAGALEKNGAQQTFVIFQPMRVR